MVDYEVWESGKCEKRSGCEGERRTGCEGERRTGCEGERRTGCEGERRTRCEGERRTDNNITSISEYCRNCARGDHGED